MQSVAWQAYDEASKHFFETYESVRFSVMHRSFLKFLPPKGAACLDVGAGSGRDAAALARRGYQVTAVEPSNGLRDLAQKRHDHPRITWVNDALPSLSDVLRAGQHYRFILLSAVWMHIPPAQRLLSLITLEHLLDANGCIAFTLRMGEACQGRVMYPVSVDELLELASRVGLHAIYVSRKTHDSFKRNEVEWRKVVLAKHGYSGSTVNSSFA